MRTDGLRFLCADCETVERTTAEEVRGGIMVLALWGPCDGDFVADLDHDGEVGITDFLGVLAAWGPCP